jgi:hypothetical protein
MELSFQDNSVEINEKVPVTVEEKIFEQFEEGDMLSGKKDFNLYKIRKGEGHPPKILFTDPKTELSEGEKEIYLKKTDYSEWDLGLRGEKIAKEELEMGEDGSLTSECFEIVFPASKKDIESLLLELDSEDIRELIDLYLTGNGSAILDTQLLYILRPYLLKHDKLSIDPEQAMPSNPHALIYTNPYVGKSTTFGKIGKKADYCTPAKVLGWSGADNSSRGSLDGLTEALGIDELNESGRDEKFLKRGFLPLMRDGKYKAEQGHGVATETWSPLVFMSNPKESGMEDSLVHRFRDSLLILSDNYGALGSRTGVIMYGEDFEPVENSSGDYQKAQDLGKAVSTIFQLAKVAYSNLVKKKEVQEWLNQEFPDNYEEEVERRSEDLQLREVRKFWREHLNASTHTRGHALRNACLDYINQLVIDEIEADVEEILESAEDHFERLIQINLDSLEKISSSIDQKVMEDLVKRTLDDLQPKYLRFFAYGVIAYSKSSEDNLEKFNPLTVVKNSYQSNKQEFLDSSDASQYGKFSVIKKRVEQCSRSKQGKLEAKTGIKLTEMDGTTMWKINNVEKFNRFLEADVLHVQNEPESTQSTSSTQQERGLGRKILDYLGEEKKETQKVIDALDRQDRKVEEAIDRLISEGKLFEPEAGKIKKL